MPGLEDPDFQNADISFTVTLVGMDRPGICSQVCAASAGTSFVGGSFSCSATNAPDVSGCAVTFTLAPAPTTQIDPILPPEFTLNFAFPNTRAQGIRWDVSSRFGSARAHSYGVSGTELPPLASASVLYGYSSQPTEIPVLIRPAILQRFNRLFDAVEKTPVPVYLSYVAGPRVLGAVVNASNYYTPFARATDSTSPPGVFISVQAQRDTSITYFGVSEIDPNGVVLVSSVSALVGGLFSIIRFTLKMTEKLLHERRKRILARSMCSSLVFCC